MTPQVWIPLVAQGLLPPVWMGWLALGPRHARWAWATHSAALGALLLATSTAGLWLALPRWLLPVWVTGWLAASVVGWRRSRGRGGRSAHPVLTWVRAAFALFLLAMGIQALLGRIPIESASTVTLGFPLEAGTYLVANGGSNSTVKAHLHTLGPEPRFEPYRGQSYAVDLVGVGSWGSRTSGLHPSDPERYAIFGRTVLAPCAGEVVAAVDGLPDLPVPQRDRERMAGNHVILVCEGIWVVLGHLRAGSVMVSPGDTVSAGDPVGEVGNSGNTDEPHLHIHAQTPGTLSEPLSGDPLPMLIDGAWLVRNQRITHAVDSKPASSRPLDSGAHAMPAISKTDTRRLP